MRKRVFFVVFNGFSLGALPGSPEENNKDLFTLQRIYKTGKLNIPLLRYFGLFNIEGVDFGRRSCLVCTSFGRCFCDPVPESGSCIKDLTGLSGITSGGYRIPEDFSVKVAGSVCSAFKDDEYAEKLGITTNKEAVDIMIKTAKSNFSGICIVSLLDNLSKTVEDAYYSSYVSSVNYIDRRISQFTQLLRPGDILILTSDAADLGCIVPFMVYGDEILGAVNLGTRESFKDVGATVAEYLGFVSEGKSFLSEIEKTNLKGKENENQ